MNILTEEEKQTVTDFLDSIIPEKARYILLLLAEDGTTRLTVDCMCNVNPNGIAAFLRSSAEKIQEAVEQKL